MKHHTKALRISLLNNQVEALGRLAKIQNISLSQALIRFLNTTNLNVQNDTSDQENNPTN